MPSIAARLPRPRSTIGAGLAFSLILLSGCARTIVTGPGAGGGAPPGSAGGRPGIAADVAISPNTTSPSQPTTDVTPGQTVTPVGSGPGGGGTPYP